ncbi:MAG: NUDIX domain-containing protein [Candidatus Peribacteraceae bacterium]|nr:NUDIX domain-containing protein [Candidatus Peribacteraceae bacterium]
MPRHFTSTAFVVDDHKRTLLLWHKRLGRWMPPGGHIEDDETPEETAKRECKEETGLDVEIIGTEQENMFASNPAEGRMLKSPIALLLEEIPASVEPFNSAQNRQNEPAHQHMDFVYLARPLDTSQKLSLDETEGRELRWFTLSEIASLDPSSEIFFNVQTYILSILKD